MIAVGLGLASLAGLELSIREHYAAYRSHTLLLSAAVGVPVFGALFVGTKLNPASAWPPACWRSGAPPGSSRRPSAAAPAAPSIASGVDALAGSYRRLA